MPSINLTEHEVKAWLDGTLSLIIRPIKPQGDAIERRPDGVWRRINNVWFPLIKWDCGDRYVYCPIGAPGDTLIGKETWGIIDTERPYLMEDLPLFEYTLLVGETQEEKIDSIHTGNMRLAHGLKMMYKADSSDREVYWRSPATMPQWASRIRLEVVNVRAVRLMDLALSKEDCEKAGVQFTDFGKYNPGKMSIDGGKTYHERIPQQHDGYHVFPVERPEECLGTAYAAFLNMWDTIYGKQFPVESSPWAWVVEVKEA